MVQIALKGAPAPRVLSSYGFSKFLMLWKEEKLLVHSNPVYIYCETRARSARVELTYSDSSLCD